MLHRRSRHSPKLGGLLRIARYRNPSNGRVFGTRSQSTTGADTYSRDSPSCIREFDSPHPLRTQPPPWRRFRRSRSRHHLRAHTRRTPSPSRGVSRASSRNCGFREGRQRGGIDDLDDSCPSSARSKHLAPRRRARTFMAAPRSGTTNGGRDMALGDVTSVTRPPPARH